MEQAWIDVAIFFLCACGAWWFFNRRTIKESKEPDFELSFLSTEDPTIEGQRFESFERWFNRQVILSRIPVADTIVPLLMVCIAGVIGAIAFVVSDNLLLGIFAAISSLLVCLISLAAVAQWRLLQFRKQLPLALDIMAGSVRSGDSLHQAVGLLANTLQEPAKTEFVRCRNQLDMGLSLRSTMSSLAKRIGSFDTRLFATTLAVHRETGGHLTSTLQRMARVIRSRFEYERHMQATTGMGRMSVIVVVALAWLIFGYIVLMKPDYGSSLWEKPQGQQMLLFAFVMELIGIVWALGLMRAKY